MATTQEIRFSPDSNNRSDWARRLNAINKFLRSKPLGTTGAIILLLAIATSITAPLIAPADPYDTNVFKVLKAPSSEHWFGTDSLGRDVLSRTMYGSGVSIYVGIISMLMASTIGSIVAVSSAYYGGKYDLIIQRVVDSLSAFPSLLLALALMAALGSSLNNVILAITIVFLPRISRVVRSVALSVKEMPYIEASRAIGGSDTRIMFRHLLPNTFASLVVISTSLVGSAIIIEASLSFLGLSGAGNTITWGAMLNQQQLFDFAGAPWIGLFPGFALTLVVFGINIFGDALRDVLDPKLRGR
ncbi:MAG: peptide/nickel transport system permease protein [Chloroflexi bacterium]|jgi:peptide/nickel transport system permease protein|nr:MAG: peptide/nickel transport system permease protein [Chloroflexota bacterium]